MNSAQFQVEPIAYVESPYKQKFAIPRQPGLVPAAKGRIVFINEYNNPDCVKDIEQYSHLWVLFLFHATREQGWKPLVRPPRLGGNATTGVLATRSTFRPNNIGMSVVTLDSVDNNAQQLILNISGLDLLEQTPIIDIKPYIPYSDSIVNASAGIATLPESSIKSVEFLPQAMQLLEFNQTKYPDLQLFIKQVLQQDPRPAYKKGKPDDKQYRMQLYHFDIHWHVLEHSIVVHDIICLS